MITYNPTGTVSVEIDGDTFTLGRPKFRQWRYFKDQISKLTDQKRDELNALARDLAEKTQALEDAKAKDKPALQEEVAAAAAALKEFSETPFYETSSELVREMFKQLADKPLPDDKDEWPVFLVADVTLPGQILNHWQTAPKASGAVNGQ